MRPNSSGDRWATDATFDSVFPDGQCGLPYLDMRLLLLNAVGSIPHARASPEQVIPIFMAILSIAAQMLLCVILFLPRLIPGCVQGIVELCPKIAFLYRGKNS